jgi:hypothetical protein
MHEPRVRRIVFSIVFSRQWLLALLVFKSKKRDDISTGKLKFGVFTQPGPKADIRQLEVKNILVALSLKQGQSYLVAAFTELY